MTALLAGRAQGLRAFGRTALDVASGAILVAAYPLYLLGAVVRSETGLARTLGLFLVLGLGFVGLGAALAGLARWRRPAGLGRAGALLQGAVVAGAYGSLALVGLAIWYGTAPLAPRGAKLAAALVVCALIVSYLRAREAERAFVATSLVRLGALPLALLAVATPYVAYAALTDRPAIAGAPQPPASPALRAGAPRRIVLVTFDALRARSTSLHRPASGQTPHLARLAAEGTWFSAMRASTDYTSFATPVIHTGMHPARLFAHVGHRSGAPRIGSYTGIAGFMRRAGYHTFAGTMLLDASSIAVGQEYDATSFLVHFIDSRTFNTAAFIPLEPAFRWLRKKVLREPDAPDMRDVLQATRTTFERARAHLEGPDERVFVWLHLAPPHIPYVDIRGPIPAAPRMDDYKRRFYDPFGSPEQRAVCEAAYENYVRFADAELGRFWDGLRASGLADDTLLVVTADHGEEFVAGLEPHGNSMLNESVTNVPLVIRGPGVPAGRRVDTPVGHVDLLPTLLSATYRELPTGLDGVSLLAPPDADRTVFSWGLVGLRIEEIVPFGHVAAYHRRFKYIRAVPSGAERLYDLVTDPLASKDMIAAQPLLAARLRREVDAYLAVP